MIAKHEFVKDVRLKNDNKLKNQGRHENYNQPSVLTSECVICIVRLESVDAFKMLTCRCQLCRSFVTSQILSMITHINFELDHPFARFLLKF
jgi:hypothetical protein